MAISCPPQKIKRDDILHVISFLLVVMCYMLSRICKHLLAVGLPKSVEIAVFKYFNEFVSFCQ